MPSTLSTTTSPAVIGAIDVALAARATFFVGRAQVCPVCGWHVRTFTRGGRSVRARYDGYCPRCNVKARHRRIWLYLQEHTDLFDRPTRLFHVSPKYGFARRFARMPGIDHVGLDLVPGPHVRVVGDLTAVPLRSESFDAAICVHVLEEVVDDARAMGELHRLLVPGGWAVVTVPTRMDQPTYEDWSITEPRDRKREFGERAHVRVYGRDLVERLASVGFDVEIDLAADVDDTSRRRYGIRDDENIFLCRRR